MNNKKDIESSDDSEDEYIESRIGKVPMQWYEKEEHVGYNTKGKQVQKLEEKNQIEKLLEMEENPQFWKTITDELNQKVHVLNKDQIELIKKIRKRTYINDKIKDGNYNIELEKNIFPMSQMGIKKSNFMQSKNERLKINKIVYAMKMGWIKPQIKKQKINNIEKFFKDVHDSWLYNPNEDIQIPRINAPKQNLPENEQSYNPAPEYFENEIQQQQNLRNLQSSQELIKDRFKRLMNLYLAPRIRKKKIHMTEDDFIQQLPDIKELRPFPQKCIYNIKTDLGLIISIDIYQNDNYILIADQFNNIEIYHCKSGRKILKMKIETENIQKIKFTKNGLLIIICEENIQIYTIRLNKKLFENNIQKYKEISQQIQKQNKICTYEFPYFNQQQNNKRQYICELMRINFNERIIQSDLHLKEEYILIVSANKDDIRNIYIININKLNNTKIKVKTKSKIQNCIFHNKKSSIIIMTLSHIFIFDLKTQSLNKKLISGCKRLSCYNIHKSGQHIIVGSYDKKLLWFDLDSNQYPYKKFNVHDKAIRSLDQSKRYDLLCTAGDDGKIIIQHSKIDLDGLSMPIITPLKILQGFKKNKQGLSIFDIKFLNNNYWLCGVGSYGLINIYA